ncbi:chemotaxis protein CheC [Ligilactobacillus sp. WC1T17]|uniref:Chemotaxis protein CheC n=1 Tax=Ligilactobacillus ruminis TaxID=1623 RepID=A0ABY1AAZ9_9LACO|nr:chemotaxis protein CheC [Ligilactobacillus ruminis]
MKQKYTDLELDGLKEVMNIGGGNAATSISQMVNSKIDMKVPSVEILSYSELYDRIISDDVEVHAILSRIVGDFEGALLFVLSDDAADKLAGLMMGMDDVTGVEREVKASAVSELTNIVANSFLRAIGSMLNIQLVASLPDVSYDYFGAVISSAYMAFDQYDEQVMVIRNEFLYMDDKLDASLFLIPEVGMLDKMFKSLGI